VYVLKTFSVRKKAAAGRLLINVLPVFKKHVSSKKIVIRVLIFIPVTIIIN
jgi:hypothetical protein